MWARLVGFNTKTVPHFRIDPNLGPDPEALYPVVEMIVNAAQAAMIWKTLGDSNTPAEVEFEIVVKKTAEAIGD